MFFGTFGFLSCCDPLVFFVFLVGDLGEVNTEGSGRETTGDEDESCDSFDEEEVDEVWSIEDVEMEVKIPPFLLPFFALTLIAGFSSDSGRDLRGGSPFGRQAGTIEGESKSEMGRT